MLFTGTGTAVGKTWWAAAMARAMRERGETVAARKPAQSFDPGEGPTDADVLAAATGVSADAVCPRHRWYEVPMAPPMAAARLGRDPFTIADLARELEWPDGTAVGFVEGAGGPRSPLADDGDTVDLAAAICPDAIVLVADAGLGTINAIRLALPVLREVAPVTVALNRYDPGDDLHRHNADWLTERTGFAVMTSVDCLVSRIV